MTTLLSSRTLFGAIHIDPVGFFADEAFKFFALFTAHTTGRRLQCGPTFLTGALAKAMDKVRRHRQFVRR